MLALHVGNSMLARIAELEVQLAEQNLKEVQRLENLYVHKWMADLSQEQIDEWLKDLLESKRLKAQLAERDKRIASALQCITEAQRSAHDKTAMLVAIGFAADDLRAACPAEGS